MLSALVLFIVLSLLQLTMYPFAMRVLFRWHQVDYYNPLTQSILSLTNTPVRWVSAVCKTTKTFDIPAFCITLVLSISIVTIKKHSFESFVTFPSLVLLGSLEVVSMFCFLYLIAGGVFAFASFFQLHNPNTKVCGQLIAYQLNTLRRMSRNTSSSAVDFSFCLWWILLLSLHYSLDLVIMRL